MFRHLLPVVAFGFLALAGAATHAADVPVRERIAFNADWRFHQEQAGKESPGTN